MPRARGGKDFGVTITLETRIDLKRPTETQEERYTVRQLKTALNRLGWYTPDAKTGMNDDIAAGLQDAVYAFQRKATIFFDDVALGPGSTTERILNSDLAAMDDHAFYIWRTVGDGKVRGEHARRAGQIFSWVNPPGGENPGEDYNCRCWAEPVVVPYHPWIEWVDKRREERLAQSSVVEKLAPRRELKNEIPDLMTPVDAINPTISPLDFIGFSNSLAKTATKEVIVPAARAGASTVVRLSAELTAKLRDVDWIRNAPISQLQKKFKHAKDFGIKGNQNKENIESYKKALEKHVRSPDTIKKPGTLHRATSVTHYVNPKTGINVMRNTDGDFISGWKPSPDQMKHILRDGKLGGSK